MVDRYDGQAWQLLLEHDVGATAIRQQECAISIQKINCPDSIIARDLLLADFCNKIGQQPKWRASIDHLVGAG